MPAPKAKLELSCPRHSFTALQFVLPRSRHLEPTLGASGKVEHQKSQALRHRRTECVTCGRTQCSTVCSAALAVAAPRSSVSYQLFIRMRKPYMEERSTACKRSVSSKKHTNIQNATEDVSNILHRLCFCSSSEALYAVSDPASTSAALTQRN